MAHCININHPEYKKLVPQFKGPEALLKAKISIWQENNGLDNFPTIDQLEERKNILYDKMSIEGFKNWVNNNQSNIQYQLPQNREIEEFVASEKTIRDLAARMSDRIGIPARFESDRSKKYKGKIENDTAYINLAYATLDTPIHEILGHPIIRALKYSVNIGGTITLKGLDSSTKRQELSPLYQNLLKELETGRGKEVFEQVKRDYVTKEKPKSKNYNLIDSKNNSEIEIIQNFGKYWFKEYNETLTRGKQFETNKELEQLISKEQDKHILGKYTLEEQQEEAIVELLGLYTADRLDKVKDGKLISLLKRLLKEIKAFVKDLLRQREVDIDKLPDNMTLGDIADLLAYSNSKLILPGNEVVYTTPDNQQFKTYAEASKHISELVKSVEDIDLSNVILKDKNKVDKVEEIPVNNFAGVFEDFIKVNDKWYNQFTYEPNHNYSKDTPVSDREIIAQWNARFDDVNEYSITKGGLEGFIEKNKQYEQSKEIIEEWKKVNNIQYNPEEVYSRGQEFVSIVGAYSVFDVDLMMQNLLQHIEDNEKAGGKFTISAFTKPIDKQIGHLESGGGKIKFKIYPKSTDILWAANTDIYSGSVWDASEKVNKDKKSELLGVSYAKYPSLDNIGSVQPNLASIIDNLAHHHNELGITLTGNNFRLEYDDDIPYSTKKIINGINSILDQKYGKVIKPEINKDFKDKNKYSVNYFDTGISLGIFNTKEEAQDFIDKRDYEDIDYVYIRTISTNKKIELKEDITFIKNRLINERYDYDLKEYNQASQGIIPLNYSAYTDLNGKLKEKIRVFTINVGNTSNKVGMWQDDKNYQVVKNYIVGEEKNQHGVKFWILSDEFKKEALSSYKKPTPQKEYTSQALINIKIAKLKEVAKKYPRILIRSEVRPIGSSSYLGFSKDESHFQKVKGTNAKFDNEIKKIYDKLEMYSYDEYIPAIKYSSAVHLIQQYNRDNNNSNYELAMKRYYNNTSKIVVQPKSLIESKENNLLTKDEGNIRMTINDLFKKVDKDVQHEMEIALKNRVMEIKKVSEVPKEYSIMKVADLHHKELTKQYGALEGTIKYFEEITALNKRFYIKEFLNKEELMPFEKKLDDYNANNPGNSHFYQKVNLPTNDKRDKYIFKINFTKVENIADQQNTIISNIEEDNSISLDNKQEEKTDEEIKQELLAKKDFEKKAKNIKENIIQYGNVQGKEFSQQKIIFPEDINLTDTQKSMLMNFDAHFPNHSFLTLVEKMLFVEALGDGDIIMYCKI